MNDESKKQKIIKQLKLVASLISCTEKCKALEESITTHEAAIQYLHTENQKLLKANQYLKAFINALRHELISNDKVSATHIFKNAEANSLREQRGEQLKQYRDAHELYKFLQEQQPMTAQQTKEQFKDYTDWTVLGD